MFVKKPYKQNDLQDNLKQLVNEFRDFTSKSDSRTAIYANAANHLKSYFGDKVNWIGFYLVDQNNNLELGPFNGLPAVTKIKNGDGVCGSSLAQKKTLVIADVCSEPNHIVCDINSKSEIVAPVWVDKKIVAVLDSDAPSLDFFAKYQVLIENYLKEVSNAYKPS